MAPEATISHKPITHPKIAQATGHLEKPVRFDWLRFIRRIDLRRWSIREQAGFRDIDEPYARLAEASDPLEKLNNVVPWDMFAKPLAKALKHSTGSKGGRPPCNPVLMFKVLVLQALFSLSDDQAEFQIQDRLSFMRFLGLGDKVPDARTICLFREHLVEAGAIENLSAHFDCHLSKAGYLAMGGQIIDATVVAAPRQRNTDGENRGGQGTDCHDDTGGLTWDIGSVGKDLVVFFGHNPPEVVEIVEMPFGPA